MDTTRRKRGTKAKTHHTDPRIQELADQIQEVDPVAAVGMLVERM